MKRILEDLSDPELLELLHHDNQAAFVCIYNRYWSELYRCAFKIFPYQETCEDLIHDVFLFLWNKRASLNVKSLRDYLYIAVKNRALNKIRSEKSLLRIANAQPSPVSSDTPLDDRLNSIEINKIYDMALAGLPDRCREIMILSRKEHLSNKEIAARLNITPKTVENQITIALRQIRVKLDEFLVYLVVFCSLFM
ncbi:RNA polymerase sigma-70 factor [Mucilaginibacter paludis]|uniref:RNA polymerase, sigma-24 subunit, ECF subfamily n=1 Tax=Mucilaginibacter paludis DSM 18603 TaxID=714943 RepID=H1Y4U1_9SPHI|nr:RNA polymerase sigma-70 factor [Mucilaginibacter paludis]EHQ28135.1 RNA polymerase, sigma-24 subunit, ECF subfamily [Mucilaginibacter paludis DSM 18603]